ncbi:hypothetical protein ACMD2_16329 [Ananas comosus]|uniref:DHHA1 domain-containing protein n=1 Tax=Ananas comosus TaxID=4615 RepID=A0A199UN26_ANACO|nr:hypothetical protein ACMD2_16329 [Ananas comosus]
MRALKKSAVLYHYPCPDGAFAALAAHLYFAGASLPVLFFPNTVYDPIRSDSLPLDEISDVYLLDFVGPPGFVADLSSKVDREKLSAKGDASGDHEIGSNAVSGAKLLPDSHFERVHKLFKFVEDGDLWRWALPCSKAFSSGLKDLGIEYNVNVNPSLFHKLLALDPEHVISHGQETLSHKQKLIDEALARSYEIALGCGLFGHCLAVDADSISNLRSELGHQLAKRSRFLNLRGIGAVVYKVPELNNDQMRKISLRSVDLEDTTPISQKYGGGGHRNASSFMLRLSEFESWKVQAKPTGEAIN